MIAVMFVWVLAVGRSEGVVYGVVISESEPARTNRPRVRYFEQDVKVEDNEIVKVISKRRLTKGQSVTLEKMSSFFGLNHRYTYAY